MKKSFKKSRFSWIEFLGILIAMGFLSAVPAFVFGAPITDSFKQYFILYVLYWTIVSGVFCMFSAYQKHRTFDAPLQKLSNATQKVAQGDFSIYLEPMHPASKLDYIDFMFQDFNTMVEELGSIETLKNDFIGNVSHEMKTPLSIIRNYASALQLPSLSELEKQDYIHNIIGASDNLSALVTNILKLSQLENQEILPIVEPYDVSRQLAEIALAMEQSLENKEMNLVVELEEKRNIPYDPGLMELVWHNLLSNAVKFTPKHGTITLLQTSDEEFCKVTISDTGIGMSQENLNHMFDKFYQSDRAHSSEGNGLGLALTWRVLELVNGQIQVESEEGTGSSFVVSLPLN